ncbi:MAG: DUF4197 domain-containing protein [Saprospiraceae bacterium]
MKRFFLLAFAFAFTSTLSFGQLNGLLKKAEDAASSLKNGGLSQDEVGRGLKEALDKGVGEAVDFLSAKDGYYKSAYKILVPEDARKVTDKLKAVPGWSNVEKDLEEKMNRAAEIAADKAKPIFINAIKNMTFKDAMNILMGEKDAATTYLKDNTFKALFAEFMPVIQSSLDEVNAREYWRGAVNAYNKIPFVSKANPELDQYVTQKALDGMFGLVEKKEVDIRENTSSRSSELLKKVFAKQDN